MASILRVTELDFNAIKNNLKTFLSSQSEFSDYDFEGSGLNVLLDVLAYNTHYNAMLTHLKANETFLESATKRSSVVSIAKMLGYTPRSRLCSKIKVNITVVPVSGATTLTINKNTKFVGTKNGETYTFVTTQSYTANRQNTVQYPSGVFIFQNVTLYEGTYVTNNFLVASDNVSGPFIIPNQGVDITTLSVNVQTSATNLSVTTFTKNDNITEVDETSTVYWIEENSQNKFQVVFGNDILGKKLTVGNIVSLNYISTNGAISNDISSIGSVEDIQGESNIIVQPINNQKTSGGATEETVDEIKFNAPKFNASRNRAVTTQDYKSLILSQYAGVKNVAVWGGEENDPPIYGKIFITVTPQDDTIITEADKDFISEKILRPRSVVSTQYEFVDPDYIYIGFDIGINYDPRTTTLSSDQIKTLTVNKIQNYFTYNLRNLEKTFIYSNFVNSLETILPEGMINGVLVKMKLQRRVDIPRSTPTTLKLNFLTSLSPSSFKSNRYETVVTDTVFGAQLQDFPDGLIATESTTGKIKLIDPERSVVLVENAGTINYVTGEVNLTNIFVRSFYNTESKLYFTATPQELTKNISPTTVRSSQVSTNAVVAYPSKNTIIDLDDSVIDELAGINAGLVVNAYPYISTT